MKSSSQNILRNIRLRLKTGYLKEVPVEYNFMKRYPPILGHKQNAMRRLEAQKIPYMKIYDKVVERNPLYVDERIYPAYWEHDTTPLAIAKRQYDLMQQGLTEEEAYFKALEYVEQFEADAYDSMEKTLLSVRALKGSLSYVSDAKVKADIEKFRNKLQLYYYNELDLGEQGEVDHIIHKHILKWNPVQTEIRMKDPVFVMLFNALRAAVFPSIASEGDDEAEESNEAAAAEGKEENSADFAAARLTNAPFHYEEYLEFFNKLKAQPAVGRWSNVDREKLMKWIYETLALRDNVDRSVGTELQRYLDEVRDTFFPMIRFPELASKLSVPDAAHIRQVLYEQQVGYRTEANKLFVRRFYKLPRILFPAETFVTSTAANASLTRHVHENPFYLSLVLETEGFPASVLPTVQERLNELFRTDKKYRGAAVEAAGSDSSSVDSDIEDPEERFLTHGKSAGVGEQQKQGKAYRQLQFMSQLISNWRVVLGELNNPEILKGLDRLFNEEEDLATITNSFAGKASAEAWTHLTSVVDEEVINSVVEYTNALVDQEIGDAGELKALVHQCYRRAFVNRVVNLLEQYHSLKDVPANSVYEFSMEAPFTTLDFSVIEELFPNEDAAQEAVEQSADSRRERVTSFQQSLRNRLSRVIKNIPEVSSPAAAATGSDATTSASGDWDLIVRKYYRAPKSKLAQLREEWLEGINEGDNEYTRMQDMKEESLLKMEYKRR